MRSYVGGKIQESFYITSGTLVKKMKSHTPHLKKRCQLFKPQLPPDEKQKHTWALQHPCQPTLVAFKVTRNRMRDLSGFYNLLILFKISQASLEHIKHFWANISFLSAMHLEFYTSKHCTWMSKPKRLQLALSLPVLASRGGIKTAAAYAFEFYMDWLLCI